MSHSSRLVHLTRRRLVVANLVLGAFFALAAVDATCPLIVRTGGIVHASDLDLGRILPASLSSAQAAAFDEYARVIMLNDVFVTKEPRPEKSGGDDAGEIPPPDPKWTLVGTWEDNGAWQAAVFDKEAPPREFAASEGARLRTRLYAVVITEVTQDFVRFEIHSSKHKLIYERMLTWSGIRHMEDGLEIRR